MEMDQLTIRRAAVEGRLQRLRTRLNAIVLVDARLDDLNAEMDNLQELWGDFRSVHGAIIAVCDNLPAIEEHLDFECDLTQQYNAAKAVVNELIRKVLRRDPFKEEGVDDDDTSVNGLVNDRILPRQPTHLAAPELHLPKGILPTFSGDYGDWSSFSDLFMSSVHGNPRLTNAQKLFYLKTYTTGRAAALLKHIKVEDNAYEGALEALKRRFDRKDQIVTHHIQRFVDIPSVTGTSATSLRKIHDTADDVRRALQALQREERDCWLIHLILTKVDSDTRQLWVDRTAAAESPALFEDFLEFLENRAYTLETAHSATRQSSSGYKPGIKLAQHRSNSFVSTNEVPEIASCGVCQEKPHYLYFCRQFKELPVPERLRIVQRLGLCKNCLRADHGNVACTAGRCKKCNSNSHHTLLHQGPVASPAQLSFGTVSNVSCNTFASVFLATAIIDAIDVTGKPHRARALLDSASQASFVTTDLAKKLGIKPTPINLPVTGISGLTTRISSAVKVAICSRTSDFQLMLECAVLPVISGQVPSRRFDTTSWGITPDVTLADTHFNIPANIDLLIGAGAFYQLLENQQLSLGASKPVLQNTHLGWVVAGSLENDQDLKASASCFVATLQDVEESESLRDLVAKFWELEDFKQIKHLSEEEQRCEQHYLQHTVRDPEGRYIVKLPFKRDPAVIGVTGYAALHQFNTLEKRLQRDPEIKLMYHNYINGFLESGHISRISPHPRQDPTIYLPHHGVLKDSTTTKLRVVFNASLKSSNGVSLNDLLMTGPVVQQTLYDLLLGFRLHNIALTGDIEKMYLQVRVSEADRKLVRMLWKEPGEPVCEYTMNTVTFGMACAPYLATRTLLQLADDDGHLFPIAKEAMHDFYVDDCLTGAATVEEAKEKRRQLTDLLHRGGFSIRKWASNSPDVLEDVPAEDQAIDPAHRWDSETSLKTLGIQWQNREDLFTFMVSCDPLQEYFTKAQVLSTIAKIFDPLGFLGPVIVIAKLFMQELWQLEVEWNEPLPNMFNQRWRTYLTHLKDLWRIRIPRRVISINNPRRVMLHGYCDASANMYGAVLYIRATDDNNNPSSRLLCSKSRVAPIHRPTIPRLELCATVLLAQLIGKVKTALSRKMIIHETKAYSDAKVVLAWLAGDPSRWKTFVANRVILVNEILPAINWRHIATDRNPADILSRGTAPSVLASSVQWWAGPDWTMDDQQQQASDKLDNFVQQVVDKEKRKFVPIHTYRSDVSETLELILGKFSSYTRMLRVTAWLLRFVENCQIERRLRDNGPLSTIELNAANRFLIRYTQEQAYSAEIIAINTASPLHSKSKLLPLTPLLESGLLRVGGRLSRSKLPYEAKHPWILPYESPLAAAIFRHEHIKNHHLGPQALLATVRQRYWVPNGRKLARHTVWNCIPCYKANPNRQMLQQIMGQLPPQRTEPAPPFYNCGVDYGGPITLVQRRGPGSPTTKGYIALFICFATRAVHLEAVSKLSTKAFLAALIRFQCRRGVSGHIWSDRGTNFVGAAKDMKFWYEKANSDDHNTRVADHLSQRGTQWHFNAPGTPHMGGLWEAAIKSAKRHLNIVTQNARLTFEEFSTLLTEIEGILNSRPISPASSDPNDLQPLTPGHFLIGRPINATNQLDYYQVRDEPYDVRFRYIQDLQQHFWDRWSREYIPELQLKGKWHRPTNDVKPGDLVMLKRSQSPLQHWQLGRVVELHKAPDGHPRLVTLRTGNTEIVQSVHNISKFPTAEEN